ncbi:uncharacterized protein LAESUDRAFT_578363 [Laetiporus sulphureus 93-53]|uniref:Uncharacterized protein n=1 Tax=Laetiporus sulphureus 93-53 TaxID=1314785 RepID=A0A165B0E7_9APHY|nr:uncharacterized protein LAESUDRAFT_578363 [Laetiporus sulphureus 93-53]KZS99993.1 hypothetical protein LAESUDRAFT_578363 [Laetiporus sulphureus 93-53]
MCVPEESASGWAHVIWLTRTSHCGHTGHTRMLPLFCRLRLVRSNGIVSCKTFAIHESPSAPTEGCILKLVETVGSSRPTALSVERAQRVGRDERQATAETRRRRYLETERASTEGWKRHISTHL